jgi:flagellar hook-length control protein FliK
MASSAAAGAGANLLPSPQQTSRKSGPSARSESRTESSGSSSSSSSSFPDALSKVRRQSARKPEEVAQSEREIEALAAEQPETETAPTEDAAQAEDAAAEEPTAEAPGEHEQSDDNSGDLTGDGTPDPNLFYGPVPDDTPAQSLDPVAAAEMPVFEIDGVTESEIDASIAGLSQTSTQHLSRVTAAAQDAPVQTPETETETATETATETDDQAGAIALLPGDGLEQADGEESELQLAVDTPEMSAAAHHPHASEARATSEAPSADPNVLAADLLDAPTNPKPLSHPTPASQAPPPPPTPVAPEAAFAHNNHDNIVKSVHGELLPRGGTMQIRLDPPALGALQITVEMRDGVMVASFQTTNDDATRMLSHTLNQLKHALESQGVSVDRLHVAQAPRSDQNFDRDNESQRQQQHQSLEDQASARQEQQRRELLRRMWRKLGIGEDPLDLVA